MISKIVEFVKSHKYDIILAIAIFMLSLLSFGAGYLTAREQLREPLRIESPQQ